MEMTDELRAKAHRFAYGRIEVDGHMIFSDIRAAFVQPGGELCRSWNGSPMPPGTDLFCFPGNEHPAKTIEALLRVIDDLAGKLRRLEQVPRYDISNNAFTSSGEPTVEYDATGEWMKARDVFAVVTPD